MDCYKIAAMTNGINTFKYIQENFDFNPNSLNHNGESVLLIVFRYNNEEILSEIVKNNKINYYLKNSINEDFIDYSLKYNSINILKLFLNYIFQDIEKKLVFINFFKKKYFKLNNKDISILKESLKTYDEIIKILNTYKSDILLENLKNKKYFK